MYGNVIYYKKHISLYSYSIYPYIFFHNNTFFCPNSFFEFI